MKKISNYTLVNTTGHAITFEQLIKIVCKHFEIDSDALCSKTKDLRYSKIRSYIVIIAREKKIATLTEMAKFFNRDSTALIHAVKTWQYKPEVLKNVERLKMLISSGTQA